MSPKDYLINKFYEICQYLGIDAMLVTILIILIMSVFTINDIKNWKNLSFFNKNMDIAIWASLFGALLYYIVNFIRGT